MHTLPDGAGTQRAYIQVPQSSGYNQSVARGSSTSLKLTGFWLYSPQIASGIRVNGDLELAEGDGAFVWGEPGEQLRIENAGEKSAEALLFDLA